MKIQVGKRTKELLDEVAPNEYFSALATPREKNKVHTCR